MPNMIIIDETQRAACAMEDLFQGEFTINVVSPDALDEPSELSTVAPHILLFVSKGNIPATRERLSLIRSKWPRAALLLLLPNIQSEKQLGNTPLPAHKILFKPCTKRRVVDVVDNYRSLMTDEGSLDKPTALLSTLVEFAGEKRPKLYIAYNRMISQIMALCKALGVDGAHVQQTFMLYILLLAHIDEELLEALFDETGQDAEALAKTGTHLQKMADLLELSPGAKDLSSDLKYVLKRYDGSGFPKDDVQGLDLPVSSRMINLLMDYHILLQSGKSTGQALFALHQREGWYDNVMLQAFLEMQGEDDKKLIRDVYPLGLVAGMKIASDVYGMVDGKRRKILARNEVLSRDTIHYLQRHSEDILDVTEPIQIFDDLFTRSAGDGHA